MELTPLTKISGPCIVFAGAGTGKTYTIIEKLKYLIQKEVYAPERIVCLTFSNEAVNTLKDRIMKAIPEKEAPLIRTFHSFCADLLKQYGKTIHISPEFRILVPDEAKIMLHKNLKVHPMLCSKYIETIGVAKDLGITCERLQDYIERMKKREYSEDLQKSVESAQFELNTRHAVRRNMGKNELEEKRERLKKLTSLLRLQRFIRTWNAYEKLKNKRALLDYADLNTKTLELLQKDRAIVKEYDYLIVDEFQDTNKMQFDLLVLFAPHRNITIVGDMNQSIYRFRGAYKDNIKKFKEVFEVKSEEIFALEKSYRSPNTVLRTAHKLLEKESQSFSLENAYGKEGEPISVIELKNEKEEVRKIIEIIEEELAKGTAAEEICVIFRTHNQSQRIKRALEEKKIAYSASAKSSLLMQPHIKKIVSYLSLGYHAHEKKKGGELNWWNLMHAHNIPRDDLAIIGRGIKKITEEKGDSEKLLKTLDEKALDEKTRITLELIKKILKKIGDALDEKKKQVEIIELVWKETNTEEPSIEEEKNYLKFKEWIEEYTKTESPELGDLLYHISIMEKLGISLEAAPDDAKGIRIMTNHATKGLEYEIVMLTNLAEGRFPTERMRANELLPSELMPDIAEQLQDVPDYAKEEVIEAIEKSAQRAEEKRLAYVALTRTKKRLYLTYAKEYGSRSYAPSSFLIDLDYLKNPDITYAQDLEEKTKTVIPEIVSAMTFEEKEAKKKKNKSFSPSALLLFSECQKKYEYKYLYGMPEKEPLSWEEIRLGSFVHEIMEEGVNNHFTREEDFLAHARIKYTQDEWNQVNLDDALAILRVFYHRNKNKYSSTSLTEKKLRIVLDGISFEGYADRIDVHPEGIEIIDYKTGKAFIAARHRNWQLGLYALAATELGMGPVKRITLDMLRQEKPLEFELDEHGIAHDINAPRTTFSLHEVKKELVETAKTILACYEKGFKPCDIEAGCDFCNEFIWKI